MNNTQPRRPGGTTTGGQFAEKTHSAPEAGLTPVTLTPADFSDVLRDYNIEPNMPYRDAAGNRIRRGHPDGIQWLADSGEALLDEASRFVQLAQMSINQRNVAIARAQKERAEALMDEGIRRKRIAGAEAQKHGITLRPTVRYTCEMCGHTSSEITDFSHEEVVECRSCQDARENEAYREHVATRYRSGSTGGYEPGSYKDADYVESVLDQADGLRG